MRKLFSLLTVVIFAFATVACTHTEKEVAKWGAGGAAVGALGGAVLGNGGRAVMAGATVGALAGGLIGYMRTKDGVRYCQYRDHTGRRYEARCRQNNSSSFSMQCFEVRLSSRLLEMK